MRRWNKSVCPIHYEPTLTGIYVARWLCELNDLRTRCWNKLVWMEKYDGLDDWDRVIKRFRTRCWDNSVWMKKYSTSWLLIVDDATDSFLNSEEVFFFLCWSRSLGASQTSRILIPLSAAMVANFFIHPRPLPRVSLCRYLLPYEPERKLRMDPLHTRTPSETRMP